MNEEKKEEYHADMDGMNRAIYMLSTELLATQNKVASLEARVAELEKVCALIGWQPANMEFGEK